MKKTTILLVLLAAFVTPQGAGLSKKARKKAAKRARQEAEDVASANKMLLAGIESNEPVTVTRALSAGASIFLPSHADVPLLAIALRMGNAAIIRSLFENNQLDKIDPCTAIRTFSHPYDEGVRTHQTLNYAVSKVARVCPGLLRFGFHYAMNDSQKRINFLKFLIDQGAPIDGSDEHGCTALILAAQEGFLTDVKLLVERGAACDLSDNEGRTPLMFACKIGGPVVRYLVGKKADIHARSNQACTALHFACVCNRDSVAKFLLQQGASTEEVEDYPDAQSLLALAIENKNVHLAQLLLNHRAKITGWHMMKTMCNGLVDLAVLLFERGDDCLANDVRLLCSDYMPYAEEITKGCTTICNRTCGATQGSIYWNVFQLAQELREMVALSADLKE